MTVTPSRFEIGIDDEQRQVIARGLSRLPAESFRRYLKTHHDRWNVTGPVFQTLHGMFMTQYTGQWNALDLIADRIRALGVLAPGTFTAFASLSSITEDSGVPGAQEVIRRLVEGSRRWPAPRARCSGRPTPRTASPPAIC